jgi:hypothetical protein
MLFLFRFSNLENVFCYLQSSFIFHIPLILEGSDVLLLNIFIKFCLEQRIESTLPYESAHSCYL